MELAKFLIYRCLENLCTKNELLKPKFNPIIIYKFIFI